MLVKLMVRLSVLLLGLSYVACTTPQQQSQLATLHERMNQMISALYSSPLLSKVQAAASSEDFPSTSSSQETAYSYSPPAPAPQVVYVSPSSYLEVGAQPTDYGYPTTTYPVARSAWPYSYDYNSYQPQFAPPSPVYSPQYARTTYPEYSRPAHPQAPAPQPAPSPPALTFPSHLPYPSQVQYSNTAPFSIPMCQSAPIPVGPCLPGSYPPLVPYPPPSYPAPVPYPPACPLSPPYPVQALAPYPSSVPPHYAPSIQYPPSISVPSFSVPYSPSVPYPQTMYAPPSAYPKPSDILPQPQYEYNG